jgi:hypothetical protein
VINLVKIGVRKVMLNREWFLGSEQDVNFIKVEYKNSLFTIGTKSPAETEPAAEKWHTAPQN